MPQKEVPHPIEPTPFRHLSTGQALYETEGFVVFGHYPHGLAQVEQRMYEETYNSIKAGHTAAIQYKEVLERFGLMKTARSFGGFFCYPHPEASPEEFVEQGILREQFKEQLEESLTAPKPRQLRSGEHFRRWFLYEHIENPILVEPGMLAFLTTGSIPKKKDRKGNDTDTNASINGDSKELVKKYQKFLHTLALTTALTHSNQSQEQHERL